MVTVTEFLLPGPYGCWTPGGEEQEKDRSHRTGKLPAIYYHLTVKLPDLEKYLEAKNGSRS